MTRKIHIPPKTVLLGKRLYVPRKYINQEILKENYEKKLYDDRVCSRCSIREDRHCDECEVCPAYKGHLVLWNKEKIDGKRFIGLPPVHLKKPKELFNLPKLDILDIRADTPMDGKIKFTGKLRTGELVNGSPTVNQVKVVNDWMQRKSGIIESPPRSGKTTMSVYIVCALKVKTLIIAHQHDYLRQFYETFVGGDSKRQAMTSLQYVENKYNRIRIINTLKDFNNIESVDVVLINYQKFIRNKKAVARIKLLANRSLLIVDEVHQSASAAYIKFLAELKCRYRCGLSATPDRKDSRSLLIKEWIGNVTAKAVVQAKIPEIHIKKTKYKYKYVHKLWVYAMKALSKNEKRNKLIVKMLYEDFKEGKHTGAILPVDYLEHAKDLQNLINDKFGENGARIFSSKCDRVRTLQDFDNGEFKILIAIRSMIKQGIDLSSPSLLYVIIPMSATVEHGSPMAYQLCQRISTIAKNKPQPIVRLFVDNMPQSMGCFRSLFWLEFVKHSKGKHPRYIIPPSQYAKAQLIGESKKSSGSGFERRPNQVRSLLFD